MSGAEGSSRNGRSRQDDAYEIIRERILSGEFPPGTFLSARELAEELQMSKSPMHAAFSRLDQEGYVVVSPQRGAVVRGLTHQEVIDHYDLRVALETHVVRKLAGRIPDDVAGELEELLRQQGEAQAAGDLRRYIRLDADFHVRLSEATGNREIARIMRNLRDRLRRTIEMGWQQNQADASYRDHQEIYRLLTQGDAEGAASVMNGHLRRATNRWAGQVGRWDDIVESELPPPVS